MRLNVRRVQPGAVFNSFFGILDIKLGCEIIMLFGLINKVAGVYGLITVFIGASFWQYLFYAYSVVTLFAFMWGLGMVKEELAHKTLLVAHLFLADHVVQQVFHYIFFYNYWYIQKHDGSRVLNSQAQKDIYDLALSRGEISPPEGEASNKATLALGIWEHEKGYALGVVFIGFMIKIYCIMVLYSYAAHLRKSTYHQLPLTERAHATRERIVASRAAITPIVVVDSEQDELAAAEAEAAAEFGANGANGGRSNSAIPPQRAQSPHNRPPGPPRAVSAPAVPPNSSGREGGRDAKPKIEAVEEEHFSWD